MNEEVTRVLALSAAGHNNCEIARRTGVPRSTISAWVNGRTPRYGTQRARGGACLRCGGVGFPFPAILESQYAYLLGLYLGDGCLLRHPRGVHRLHVALDAAHPVIAAECEAAMAIVMPASRATCHRDRRCRMLNVVSYSTHWPHLFPQHGPGVKHRRRIALEPWQQRIVDRYPGRLLRGLIHSDGCRVVNRIRRPKKTYAYPRYFFSNRSLDIQRVFCAACDRLEVAWRQDGRWSISVARRDAVAVLDRHIGPKR
ncbi:MAG TPA: helix-turn-helix transcriptional regulator [Solirubrobacterales bacterium]|nr:helix-turn-helix transcriptional regulator [Solirubrobacterales bacterium]